MPTVNASNGNRGSAETPRTCGELVSELATYICVPHHPAPAIEGEARMKLSLI